MVVVIVVHEDQTQVHVSTCDVLVEFEYALKVRDGILMSDGRKQNSTYIHRSGGSGGESAILNQQGSPTFQKQYSRIFHDLFKVL